MKLERLHESLLPTFVLAGGLLLAIYAGSAAGSGRFGTVGMILAAIFGAAVFFIVRQRMWMLIPACWMLGGKVMALPLPFSIGQLAVMTAFGTFLLLKAFKIIRIKPKSGIVEVWMILVLVYLGSVFLRNPVGVEALGSDRVGGKPYFDVVIAYLGFWVLSRAVASPTEAFFVPLLMVAGNAFHAIVNVIAYRFPWTIGPLTQLYSGIAAAENLNAPSSLPGADSGRRAHLVGFGSSLWLYATANWRPITLLNPMNFGRFLITVLSVWMVLLSGFRSFLFGMMVNFMLGTYFRRGATEVVKSGLVGVVALAVLILMQGTIIQLPLSAQRALSFLPGDWDYMAKSEAEGSTQWRIEMWKAMLTTDKYIASKWLGDGFGFTRHQLQMMAANNLSASNADQQENLMISGGVHSGPISTIRYVGYVGLALFIVFLILIARRSLQLINRAKGTPYYTLALFVGFQSLYQLFSFIFVFGAFEADLPFAILAVGMQKLLENSLDAHATPQGQEKTQVRQISTPLGNHAPLAHARFHRPMPSQK